MARSRQILALFALVQVLTLPAFADLTVCQQSNHEVMAAYSYYDQRQRSWFIAGWYKIAPHSCRTLHIGDVRNSRFYVYAEVPGTSFKWTGNWQLCVQRPESFSIRNVGQTCNYIEKYQVVETGRHSNYTYTFMMRPEHHQALNDELAHRRADTAPPPRDEPRSDQQPLAAASFKCTPRSNPAERTICGAPSLARLDVEMATAFGERLKRLPAAAEETRRQQRQWLLQRDACGAQPACIEQAISRRLTELRGQDQIAAPASKVADAPGNCTALEASARRIAAGASLRFDPASGTTLAVGSKIKARWTLDGAPPSSQNVYLVVSAPAEVRFGGTGFLALTAGAKGPNGLIHAHDRARAVVPLDRVPSKPGEIDIIPWRAGPLVLEWAVVAASLRCETFVASNGRLPPHDVTLGPLKHLVVQDRFADGQPLKTLRDPSGRYELFIYKDRYDVRLASNTGEAGDLVLSRAGWDPNFSPTGRFVASHNPIDQDLEIIDLVSTEVIAKPGTGMLAWARSDSLAIFGGSRNGTLTYIFTLTARLDDPPETGRLLGTCTLCYPWPQADVFLNFDRGFIAATSTPQFTVHDLIARQSTSREGGAQFNDDPPSPEMRRAVRQVIAERYGTDALPSKTGWDLGEPLRLSHAEGYLDEKGKIVFFKESQPSHIVQHARPRRDVTTASLPDALRGVRLARGLVPVGHVAPPETGILDRLSETVGSLSASHEPSRYDFMGDAAETKKAQFIERLVRDSPSMSARLKKDTGSCEDITKDALDTRYLTRAWSWAAAGTPYHVLRVECVTGSMGGIAGSILLVRGRSAGASEAIYELGEELGRVRPTEASPADATHECTIGLANEAGIAVFLTTSGHLMIVDPSCRSAALINSATGKRIGEPFSLSDPTSITSVPISVDLNYAVPVYSDGRFEVARLSDGKRMLFGAVVDNELVVMMEDGRYDTSFEGAEALYAQFSGAASLHSIHQFRRILKRDGLARIVLSGQVPAPISEPLGEPPRVGLELKEKSSGGQQYVAQARAWSSRGLKGLRVYVDGRLLQHHETSAPTTEINVDVPDAGLWVSAVAEDGKGLESAPVSVRLPGKPSPTGALRVMAVGVNEYDHLASLKLATDDAKTIVQTARAMFAHRYRSLDTAEILDRDATPTRVYSALETMVGAAKPEDTVVFFFSGHGGRSPEGQFFMALSPSQMHDLTASALAWSEIARLLSRSSARVVVIIDACHAGQTGLQLATNDNAAAAITAGTSSPLLVLAASKGRQLSSDGVFTQVLAELLTTGRNHTDTNQNGVIELSELYAAIKKRVNGTTGGAQTPWLVRQNLVGNFSLF